MNVLEKLNSFYLGFKGEKGNIGYTEKGKPIYYFKVEKTPYPKIIVQYSIHAREYITTYLALKQIEDFIFFGKKGCVYFIPAVNVDGIEICLKNKPLYKANANQVDLNVNFDAGWGKGQFNTTFKGDENYIGKNPFSENESKALRDFTLKIMPSATVSYHSKGEEIYYSFHQTGERLKKDYKIAKELERVTGYVVKETPNSFGGYKDWCIKTLKIPSFNLEVGADSLSHPIGEENLEEIYQKNKLVIITLLENL